VFGRSRIFMLSSRPNIITTEVVERRSRKGPPMTDRGDRSNGSSAAPARSVPSRERSTNCRGGSWRRGCPCSGQPAWRHAGHRSNSSAPPMFWWRTSGQTQEIMITHESPILFLLRENPVMRVRAGKPAAPVGCAGSASSTFYPARSEGRAGPPNFFALPSAVPSASGLYGRLWSPTGLAGFWEREIAGPYGRVGATVDRG